MPKNKITDLNNHLFEQLERLNDDQLKGEKLATEIDRAKAMASIASNIVGAAKITVEAMKLIKHGEIAASQLPTIFDNESQKKLSPG